MVSNKVCFSLVVFAVLVVTTVGKPFSEEDRADTMLADSPAYPPKVRINRHGKRGLFDDIEEQDSDDLSESNAYYAEDSMAADGPPRINRHGKRGLFDNMEEQDFEGETEYVMNGARRMDFADIPPRLRMNRHGK